MEYKTEPDVIVTSGLTFSVVIETENLGMAGIEDLKVTLACLLGQTYPVSRAREVIVVVGTAVSVETLEMLRREYPWVTVHCEGRSLEYLESKICGARKTTGDVVVFMDSDAVYESVWLESMLYGFLAAPGAAIISSETRIRMTSLYTGALQLMWMINANRNRNHPIPIVNYHLNNFAIRREALFSVAPFLGLPVYRANNVEWKKQLTMRGYSAVRVPGILSHHAPPATVTDWWWRMLVLGADAVSKADFYFQYGAVVTEKFSPLRRLVRVPLFLGFKLWVMTIRAVALIRERPKNVICVIFSLPVAIGCMSVMVLGSLIALCNRDYVFNRITARERAHVV